MKQRKEESLLWDYGWIFLVVTLVVLFLWYFNPAKQEQRFCEANREKCVCTIWTNQQSIYPECVKKEITKDAEFCTIQSYHCSKFRKKTQSELDIDNCNLNPREDDLCKCLDYCNIDEDIKNPYPKEKVSQCYNFTRTHDLMKVPDPSNFCLKSRPKTDWEKYPEEYVAETAFKLYCDGEFMQDLILDKNNQTTVAWDVDKYATEYLSGQRSNKTISCSVINQTIHHKKYIP